MLFRRFSSIPLLLLLSGCPPVTDPSGPIYAVWSNWPVDTDGFDQFYTNDPQYARSGGVVFWRVTSPAETPMSVIETQMKKLSGDPLMGFGIIFCIQSDRFLMVKIDTKGYYGISKIVGDDETVIRNWTYTDYLNKNDALNTLSVEYNRVNNAFELFINTHSITSFTETSFTDPIDAAPLGGSYGSMVGVSSKDDFPSTPVDLRFKQTSPGSP